MRIGTVCLGSVVFVITAFVIVTVVAMWESIKEGGVYTGGVEAGDAWNAYRMAKGLDPTYDEHGKLRKS